MSDIQIKTYGEFNNQLEGRKAVDATQVFDEDYSFIASKDNTKGHNQYDINRDIANGVTAQNKAIERLKEFADEISNGNYVPVFGGATIGGDLIVDAPANLKYTTDNYDSTNETSGWLKFPASRFHHLEVTSTDGTAKTTIDPQYIEFSTNDDDATTRGKIYLNDTRNLILGPYDEQHDYDENINVHNDSEVALSNLASKRYVASKIDSAKNDIISSVGKINVASDLMGNTSGTNVDLYNKIKPGDYIKFEANGGEYYVQIGQKHLNTSGDYEYSGVTPIDDNNVAIFSIDDAGSYSVQIRQVEQAKYTYNYLNNAYHAAPLADGTYTMYRMPDHPMNDNNTPVIINDIKEGDVVIFDFSVDGSSTERFLISPMFVARDVRSDVDTDWYASAIHTTATGDIVLYAISYNTASGVLKWTKRTIGTTSTGNQPVTDEPKTVQTVAIPADWKVNKTIYNKLNDVNRISIPVNITVTNPTVSSSQTTASGQTSETFSTTLLLSAINIDSDSRDYSGIVNLGSHFFMVFVTITNDYNVNVIVSELQPRPYSTVNVSATNVNQSTDTTDTSTDNTQSDGGAEAMSGDASIIEG